MLKTLQRIRKGLIYLFSLACIFIACVVIIQSCDRAADTVAINQHPSNFAVQNFKSSMKTTQEKIFKEKNNAIKSNSLQLNMMSIDEVTPGTDNANLEEATIFEQEIHNASMDLIKSYGITTEDLSRHFDDLNDPNITIAAELIVYMEERLMAERKKAGLYALDFRTISNVLGISLVYAQSNDLVTCSLTVIGIKELIDFVNSQIDKQIATDIAAAELARNAERKLVLKIIGKVATRTLGAVGAVIAAYEFAKCMKWIAYEYTPVPVEPISKDSIGDGPQLPDLLER